MVQGRDQSSFSAYKCPIAPASFAERNILPLLNYFCPSVCKDLLYKCLNSISGFSVLFHCPTCLSFTYNVALYVLFFFSSLYSKIFNLKGRLIHFSLFRLRNQTRKFIVPFFKDNSSSHCYTMFLTFSLLKYLISLPTKIQLIVFNCYTILYS